MTLNVLIVDDECLARARLRTLPGECTAPAAQVAGEAANATQAMAWLQHHRADVVFLDIWMPGTDGLALADLFKTMSPRPAVVFVTAYADHAVQAFALAAVDYLTKPVRRERLQEALQKIERNMQYSRARGPDFVKNTVRIQNRGLVHQMPLAQVVYFKAELKYVTVRTRTQRHILEGSLDALERKFPLHFLRIHRHTLIARHALRALEKHCDPAGAEAWSVRLDGVDERLPVARRQLAAVRAMLISPCF